MWVCLQGDNDKLASIYANALVELAQAKNALDTVHADVDSLQVLLDRIDVANSCLML